MRLNRVLLLAAVISMAMAAMVFTISCSGDDGKDGSSCTAERKGDEGYSIKCGGVEQGFIPFTGVKGDKGDKGDDGANCTWVAGVTFNCDGHTVNLGGTGGGGSGCQIGKEDPYNENELVIQCPGSESLYLCAGYLFDPKINYCYNGQDRNQDKNSSDYNVAAAGSYGYQALLRDTADFTCDITGGTVFYNPNKQFCTNGTPNKLTDLCGGGDFDNANQFCLQSNFNAVVRKCGTSIIFAANQFCRTTAKIDSVNGSGVSVGPFVPRHYASTGADTATLCGGAQYGTAAPIKTDNTSKEISSLTGGEYYFSTSPLGVAKIINSTIAGRYYYEYGDQRCQSGKVVTKCATSATSDSLFFDARDQFCRTSKDDITKLEIVDLCRKTGTTTGGTKFDGINYFCNPNTGAPGKLCQTEYYDEAEEFCYPDAATGVKVPYCKDDAANARVYDPAYKFCSYNQAGKQNQTNYCGTNLKFNEGSWKWQYCVGSGTGATAQYRVQTCLINQDVMDPADINTSCKCQSGYAMHPGTGQCTVAYTGTPTTAATCSGATATLGVTGSALSTISSCTGGGTLTCSAGTLTCTNSNKNCSCSVGGTLACSAGTLVTSYSCECPVGYPWNVSNSKCQTLTATRCDVGTFFDPNPANALVPCPSTCNGGALATLTGTEGICTCPASHPWQAIPSVNSGNARCQTNTNGCPVGQAWDSYASTPACVNYAACTNTTTVAAGSHTAECAGP